MWHKSSGRRTSDVGRRAESYCAVPYRNGAVEDRLGTSERVIIVGRDEKHEFPSSQDWKHEPPAALIGPRLFRLENPSAFNILIIFSKVAFSGGARGEFGGNINTVSASTANHETRCTFDDKRPPSARRSLMLMVGDTP
jgi:hypothetical protein